MHRDEAASLRTLRPMAGFALFGTCVRMSASMGVFDASLVLPALAMPGLVKSADTFQLHGGVFLLFAASLLLSFLFRMAVPERPPTAPSDDR